MPHSLPPDLKELLKTDSKRNLKKQSGKLKIFFGMCAGVGKTYSLLEEAQQLLKEGVAVAIGTIDTHGRQETEKLLVGLPVILKKWISYKEIAFEEMDLESILKQKPSLVLIDDLDHTNVPGSHHPKRWQDVIEILDAGIDVYTTLNVQHIESRKEIVEKITGIPVRETVPDSLIERASSIEFIDTPPSELLQRLREGKVYLDEQSQVVVDNFFKEDRLMALREIALRLTAEKVDHDLHAIQSQDKGWHTREKLMVAVNASPSSQQLIRTTRRRAFELDASWIAVYVDTGKRLKDEDQKHLASHLNLAQELGGEVITTHDLDVPQALQRLALQRGITQLVIGRPRYRSFWKRLFQKTILDRIEQENKQLDLLVLRQDRLTRVYQSIHPFINVKSPFLDYAIAFGLMLALTSLGFLSISWIGYKTVGFIFLLGILVLSFFIGEGPVFFAALLSALSWGFFFIPPPYTFSISNSEDFALIFIYFFSALIMGLVTNRVKKQDQYLQIRTKTLSNLYEIERDIANASNYHHLRQNIIEKLIAIFGGEFEILIKNNQNELLLDTAIETLKQAKEQEVALWTFQNGKTAGWSTTILPTVKGLYLPIKFSQSTVGVLVYYPAAERSLSMDEMNFLQTVTQQLGIYLERHLFEERLLDQTYAKQTEKLQRALLKSISTEFYRPLNQITQTLTNYPSPSAVQINENVKTMKEMIHNLLAIAELESGAVHFDATKQDIQQFARECLQVMHPSSDQSSILFDFKHDAFFLVFDKRLMTHALTNVVLNALKYSPANQPIIIKGQEEKHFYRLSIIDQGSGIPENLLPFIFEKFYQHSLTNHKTLGAGLGLTVVKLVMNTHQGHIEVLKEEGQGTKISLLIPL